MTTIYANMQGRSIPPNDGWGEKALNNIEQPEPENIDPKAMVTEEHKKILD